MSGEIDYKNGCNFFIIGASGDLSRKKIIPALFSLYVNGFLPRDYNVIGYARSEMNDDQFRELAGECLQNKFSDEQEILKKVPEFLQKCFYVRGQYDSVDGFNSVFSKLKELKIENFCRLFYMAIPPSVFLDTSNSLYESGLLNNDCDDFWARVVLEKPFGRDSKSYEELNKNLSKVIREDQTYRIDHYLGKEVIQNLMVLRFANLIFEPIWNRNYINDVVISWSEKIGVSGRAGYFDNYGIIRDVMQNHLMQILSLVGMEPPINLDAESIRDEKVKLLKCVEPISLDQLVVGQYVRNNEKGVPGYLEDPGVPNDSITPTYAKATLKINNFRWDGVPFHLLSAKAYDKAATEIRINFKQVPGFIYPSLKAMTPNTLVIRIQPEEAISFEIVNKYPGLAMRFENASLNLHYESEFQAKLHDAYERLLLDVLRGEKSLFIRADELTASWNIVTPVLNEMEKWKIKPHSYVFGSRGPN
ncbi:MAG: glucose-6-phosphate dehydrogenase [Planctomycetota bacterium]|nr:MAG: glucose-6-phosphate dehydrogenase [Planctomycetota bacterium]